MRKDFDGKTRLLALLMGLGVGAVAWDSHRRSLEALERNPPVGRFVTIDGGHRLHYSEAGEGPPVVLIHGASSLLQDMTTSLVPILAKRHRVVAFEVPPSARVTTSRGAQCHTTSWPRTTMH
jgi:hypothetical protein